MSDFYKSNVKEDSFLLCDKRYTNETDFAVVYKSKFHGEVLVSFNGEDGFTISELQEIVDIAREFRDKDIPTYDQAVL